MDILHPFQMSNCLLLGSDSYNYVKLGNVGQYILRAFKNEPDFIGQIDVATGRTTTFQEMREKSVKCAIYMMANGVEKGDVVSICIHNHIHAYIPYLACLYIGAIADLWRENYLKDSIRILNFVMKTKPKMIFTHSNLVEKFKDPMLISQKRFFTIIVGIDEQCSFLNELNYNITQFSCVMFSHIEPAVTMFSPTTNMFCDNIQIPHMMFTYPPNRQVPNMQKNDIGLWYTPFYSLHGPFLTVHAILAYVTVLKPGKFDEENMLKIIQEYKVNWIFLESTDCKLISTDLDVARYNLSSLREIVCDSEIPYGTYYNLMTLFTKINIIKVYSTVETGVIAYMRNSRKLCAAGYVAQSASIMIVDLKNRNQLSVAKYGEIWCKAPHVIYSDGCQYYKRSLRSVSDPTIVDYYRVNEGWFFTGDWGYYDKQGAIYVIDKVNALVKYKDTLISQNVIQKIIETHEHIKHAYTVSKRRSNNTLYIKVYVIPYNFKIKECDLFKHLCVTLFIERETDIEILMCDAPRLPNGKLDRLRLATYDRIKKYFVKHS